MKIKKIKTMLLSLTIVIAMTNVACAKSVDDNKSVISGEQALEMLIKGNQRFVNNKSINRDLLAQVKKTSGGQTPFAAVVSCLDSRVPPEIIFDQGIGKLFVARVAGNFVNDDILGSLEYATAVVKTKLIVVLGHTRCGAVGAACENIAHKGLLAATLANINPAVMAVQSKNNLEKNDFVQAVADMNVKLTIQKLRSRSIVIRDLIDSGDVKVVGAMYDVSSGKVKFLK